MRVSWLTLIGSLIIAAGWTTALYPQSVDHFALAAGSDDVRAAVTRLASMPDRIIWLGYVLVICGVIRGGFRALLIG